MATAYKLPFSWCDVEGLRDLERLRLVFEVLPDEGIVAALDAGRGRGRNDHPVRGLFSSTPRSSRFFGSWGAIRRCWRYAGSTLCRIRAGG